jgi:inactivated superfamily I helicase
MQTDLLDRVRKLLAKAEDEGCTPEEAEALTAKAAELMARYGIDRALLGALRPETDRPADRKFRFEAPWADVKAHLLAALATALRCQCVQTQTEEGPRLHVFGYSSDLERAEILFTSLLVQMARALAKQAVPAYGNSAKAWRRSWMLGYCAAVVARVRAAEEEAVAAAEADVDAAADVGSSAAVVLADRSLTVRLQVSAAYPRLKKKRVTYSGSGYGDGYREGQKADIGGAKLRSRPAGALRR